MSRILCVWELGEGLGHIGMFSQVSQQLIEQGHEVFFASKDLSRIKAFSWNEKLRLVQAPVWHPRSKRPESTHCLADILLLKGYHSEASLTPMVEAWIQLFELVKPQLIIFDHAPTALLASRYLTIPRVILSNCYVTPPAFTPPINLKPWDAVPLDKIERSELRVIEVINNVASKLGLAKIENVSDLYSTDAQIFYTYRDLDIYKGMRTHGHFIGPFLPSQADVIPRWNLSHVKVFAYLTFGQLNVDNVIQNLIKTGANVVCFYAGASREFCEQYQSKNFQISNEPFDMHIALRDADVFVCHAGLGVVSSCLQSGKPMVLMPTQIEQFHTASCIDNLHIGVVITKDDSANTIDLKLSHFFSDPSFLENAKRFAHINAHIKPLNALGHINTICLSLLNKG